LRMIEAKALFAATSQIIRQGKAEGLLFRVNSRKDSYAE